MIKHPQSSQNIKLAMSYNISSNELEMNLLFCMQINIKLSYKFISTLWVSKFPTSWYYSYWSAWSSILKVLKLTSLQYLYNTSKKGRSLFFTSRWTSMFLQAGIILVEVVRHVQIPKLGFGNIFTIS